MNQPQINYIVRQYYYTTCELLHYSKTKFIKLTNNLSKFTRKISKC